MNLTPEEMTLVANFRRLSHNGVRPYVTVLVKTLADLEECERRSGFRLIQGGKSLKPNHPAAHKVKSRRAKMS